MNRTSLLKGMLRLMVKPLFSPATPIVLQRAGMALGKPLARIPAGAQFRSEILGGVPVEVAGERGGAAILYLHGGGYCVGSPQTHRPITGTLAQGSGLPVYAVDYRLAPEHPFPAAVDDALAAYRALQDQGLRRIVLAGDSAGGGLALATAVSAARAGLAGPAALLLISPWVDLGCTNASYQTHDRRDPMLGHGGLKRWAQAYLGSESASNPLCSPLHAELRGLPPVLIQAGSEEVLLGDQHALHKALQAADVAVRLQIADGLWHVYQLHTGLLAESDAALRAMADFLGELGIKPAT